MLKWFHMTHVHLISSRVYDRKQTFWHFRNLSYTKEIHKREASKVRHSCIIRVMHPLLVFEKTITLWQPNLSVIKTVLWLIRVQWILSGTQSTKHLQNLIFISLNIRAIYLALSLDIIYVSHVMTESHQMWALLEQVINAIFWNPTELERVSSSYIFLFIGRRDHFNLANFNLFRQKKTLVYKGCGAVAIPPSHELTMFPAPLPT